VLGIQSDAVPEITVGQAASVSSVSARVELAPAGADITLVLKVDGAAWVTLTIPDGQLQANGIDGAELPPLMTGSTVSMDITGVGTTFPGQRLVASIRL
jgi:hypothetical protein